jgi:outer membrane receptor protein involved in Fe transport
MNFHYKKPTDENEFQIKTIQGDYGTNDFYGFISGPIIKDTLNGRITLMSRRHDGWVEERGFGPDLDSGDNQNAAIQFEWKINDTMNLHLRSNKLSVDRVFGGADGAGLIVLTGENTQPGGDGLRNTTHERLTLRRVDPSVTDPFNEAFVDTSQPILTYYNPKTGDPIPAQYDRPGIDPANQRPNFAFGQDNLNECVFSDRDNIDGSDVCAFSNGHNNETFREQGNQLIYTWELNEDVTLKYLFGYNELIYHRDSDDDNTANTEIDRTFYVNHEAEYVSHEIQVFYDWNEDISFTSGIFFYDATIDQRYDFYDSRESDRYTDPSIALDNILATVAPGVIPGDPPLTFLFGVPPATLYTAREVSEANNTPSGIMTQVTGYWAGAATYADRIPHGPHTAASDLVMNNRTDRDSFAAYTQGVWNINEKFTLTMGVRYAEDEVEGTEYYSQYSESMFVLDLFGLPLGVANIIRGALDPATLQPTGAVPLWYDGTPITFGLHRSNKRKDDDVTWRVNLDYNINEDSMVYANVTTGYRGGGFNLAFFSQTPEYDPEELTSFELGLKTQLFDNSLQLFASAYFYDYESIHTVTEEACPPGAPGSSLDQTNSACNVVNSTASVQAAPGADIYGVELEGMWLASDNLTIGGNFSFTDTEYTGSLITVDGTDPTTPGGIYDENNNPDRRRDIKGRDLPQIPEFKFSTWATYEIPMGGNGDIALTGVYSYTDEVYFSAFKNDLDLAPEFDRLDLRATWTSPTSAWVVTGFVNNVFDELGITQILKEGEEEGYRRSAQVTEPRLYGIEVTYTMQ